MTVKKEIDSKLKCADKRVNATVQGYFLSFLKEMIVTLYTCYSMKKKFRLEWNKFKIMFVWEGCDFFPRTPFFKQEIIMQLLVIIQFSFKK